MRSHIVALALAALSAACAHQRGAASAEKRSFEAADLWLEPVRVYGSGAWFADELHPLETALAEVLARPDFGGYRVVPPEQLQSLWSDTQQGRLPGVSFVCEAAPPPALLAQTLYAGASHAESDLRCEDHDCTLTVIVLHGLRKSEEGEQELARFETNLLEGASPTEWAEAIRKGGLKRVPPPEGGLGMLGALSGGMASGIHLYVGEVQLSGPWKEPFSAKLLRPSQKALAACRTSEGIWRDWWMQPFIIEVDTSGRINRCEFQYPDHLPPPVFACECEVLRQIPFGAAAGVRRARFNLDVMDVPPADPSRPKERFFHRAYLEKTQSPDPTATLGTRAVDEGALAECLQQVNQAMPETHVPVRFEIAADGRVRSHETAWPAEFSAPAARCMDQVLSRSRFNCPLSGATTVSAALALAVQPRE